MFDFSNLPIHLVVVIFFAAGIIIAILGSMLTRIADQLADVTGVTETIMGAIFLGGTTSLPELVTSISAVRQGALTLAVGGVIGENSFDVLFLAFADFANRD